MEHAEDGESVYTSNFVCAFIFPADDKSLAMEYVARKRTGILPVQYFPRIHDISVDELHFAVVKLENMCDAKHEAIQMLLREIGIYNLGSLDEQQEVIDTIDITAGCDTPLREGIEGESFYFLYSSEH